MKKITLDRIMDALNHESDAYPGFCLGCGEQSEGIEPDARAYACEVCGAEAVYGAEELLLMIVP